MTRFGIVVSRFNYEITKHLLAGAIEAFAEAKVTGETIEVIEVPGAFELPLVAKTLAASNKFAAIVCLGAVIRGDTDHYDYVCRAATDGILRAGMDTGVPVIFGVLTCDNEEQALARVGGSEGHKGADAAKAAIEMVAVIKKARQS